MHTEHSAPLRPSWIVLTALVAAVLLSSAPAWAEGEERHDGFMIRLGLGFGVSGATFQEPGDGELELSATGGDAGHVNIALGYAVIENLIIHAEMFGGFLTNATVKLNGEEIGELGEDTQLNLYGFGIGVTYYVMPLNLYIAGSLGAADANLQIDGETRELRDASGTAINLMVGKEWWVSDNWGLGVAAQYYRIDMEYANDGELDANAAGLLFSATFN